MGEDMFGRTGYDGGIEVEEEGCGVARKLQKVGVDMDIVESICHC